MALSELSCGDFMRHCRRIYGSNDSYRRHWSLLHGALVSRHRCRQTPGIVCPQVSLLAGFSGEGGGILGQPRCAMHPGLGVCPMWSWAPVQCFPLRVWRPSHPRMRPIASPPSPRFPAERIPDTSQVCPSAWNALFARAARAAGKNRFLFLRVLRAGFPKTAGSAGGSGGADTRGYQ